MNLDTYPVNHITLTLHLEIGMTKNVVWMTLSGVTIKIWLKCLPL